MGLGCSSKTYKNDVINVDINFIGIRVVGLTSGTRDWIRSGAADKIPFLSIRVCQEKNIFEILKSGFLICGNYRENNIVTHFRLLFFLVVWQQRQI